MCVHTHAEGKDKLCSVIVARVEVVGGDLQSPQVMESLFCDRNNLVVSQTEQQQRCRPREIPCKKRATERPIIEGINF